MTTKYIIKCLQDTDFYEWARTEPQTRQQIIEHFYQVWLKHPINGVSGFKTKKDFTLQKISNLWRIQFIKIN